MLPKNRVHLANNSDDCFTNVLRGMATFKICAFEHQQREDGTFPISIRVTWKRKSAYIKTEYRVSKKQLTKEYDLKDAFLLRELNNRIVAFEDMKVQKLGLKIEHYTAKELADYFSNKIKSQGEDVDFIDFGRKHIEALRANEEDSYAVSFTSTINALVDHFKSEKVSINQITSKSLAEFESFLKTTRTMKRINQFGREYTITREPLKDTTVYLRNIRTLFNLAMAKYNDEDKDEIIIKHYPFKKFKIKKDHEPKKRNLTIAQIREIFDLPDEGLTDRAIIARDVFIISFMLLGTNTVDLYEMPSSSIKNGRITYNREKTADRRSDDAEISIRIEPEGQQLIDKYRSKTKDKAFVFAERYANATAFNGNINKGLKVVAEKLGLGIPLSTYYARHSWATIARNDCRISKDDVHLALNHVDENTKITDVYIARDWSIIDDANRKVIDLLINVNSAR